MTKRTGSSVVIDGPSADIGGNRAPVVSTARIRPRLILLVLTIGIILLTAADLITQVGKHVYRHDVMLGFVRIFYLDAEANVPTWFSSTVLLGSALTIGLIAAGTWQRREPYRWHWTALALVFLGLSLDETAGIHETTVRLVVRILDLGGALTNTAWVLPAGAIMVVLGVVSRRFIQDLPAATRVRAVVALGFLVSGAIVVELVGGYYSYRYGYETLTYALIATVEEFMEMVGGVLFLRAWLLHIAEHGEAVRLEFREGDSFTALAASADPAAAGSPGRARRSDARTR